MNKSENNYWPYNKKKKKKKKKQGLGWGNADHYGAVPAGTSGGLGENVLESFIEEFVQQLQ